MSSSLLALDVKARGPEAVSSLTAEDVVARIPGRVRKAGLPPVLVCYVQFARSRSIRSRVRDIVGPAFLCLYGPFRAQRGIRMGAA